MNSLTITADWQLDQGAKDWLPNYCREVFEQAIVICRKVTAISNFAIPSNAIPSNPWDALKVNLNVSLHWERFDNGVGRMVAGLYTPDIDVIPRSDDYHMPRGFNRADLKDHTDLLQLCWTDNTLSLGTTLRHEFCHMIWWHADMPNWAYFGHGGYEGQMDPYLVYLKREIDDLYRRYAVEYPVTFKYPMGA